MAKPTSQLYTKKAEDAIATDDVQPVIQDAERKRTGPVAKVWAQVQSIMEFAADPDAPMVGRILAVAALIYLVSPLDAVPDLIPIAGLVDDVGVLLVTFAKLAADVQERENQQREVALEKARLQQEEEIHRKIKMRNTVTIVGAVFLATAGVIAYFVL